MHILITGATGLIGRRLTQKLLTDGNQITVLTRSPERAKTIFGNPVSYWSTLSDRESLNGVDAVVNLAGEPIADKRWTEEQKKCLCESRWTMTEQLARLINASSQPPSVLISGSAVGFYGDQGQTTVTEETPPHDEFTHQLCARWESLARQAQSDKTRVCLLRTGVVLATDGGALAKMLPLFRCCLGGPVSNGRQYFPWIHQGDMVNAIHYLLTQNKLHGPFNIVSPNPVHNKQFTRTLARVLNRPAALSVPAGILRALMGEASILMLTGQRALPVRLEDSGFDFRYAHLEEALRDILR